MEKGYTIRGDKMNFIENVQTDESYRVEDNTGGSVKEIVFLNYVHVSVSKVQDWINGKIQSRQNGGRLN